MRQQDLEAPFNERAKEGSYQVKCVSCSATLIGYSATSYSNLAIGVTDSPGLCIVNLCILQCQPIRYSVISYIPLAIDIIDYPGLYKAKSASSSDIVPVFHHKVLSLFAEIICMLIYIQLCII